MPRRSAASLTVVTLGPRRLEPPVELGAGSIEREIFAQTVAAAPPDHFASEDMQLLCAYARASALERRASEELAASAVVGSLPSPWLAVHASAARTMMQLSVRLRLGPRSRNTHTRKAKPRGTPSYYETMTMPAEPEAAPQKESPQWPRARG